MAYTQEQLDSMDLCEAVEAFVDQEASFRTEGRRGVETLCILARGLGYKDPQYWGQLTSKACVGDLIEMLEDNSGMIQAMIEWVTNQRNDEWKENLKQGLEEDDSEEEPCED